MGERDDLQAGVGTQFFEEMLNVIAHGRAADSELTGDLGCLCPAGEKTQHLELARRQGKGGNRRSLRRGEELGGSGSPTPLAAPLIGEEPVVLLCQTGSLGRRS